MKRKPKTAAELLADLETDPEYVAARAESDARIAKLAAECAADEANLVRELQECGFAIGSVWDFVNGAPINEHAYPILVRHLDVPHHKRIREGIARALTTKDAQPWVEEALFRAFQSERAYEVRWAIANALMTVMPSQRRNKYPEIEDTFRRDSVE